MKQKIIKILKKHQHEIPQLNGVTNDLVITDDQFEEVAEEIMELINSNIDNFIKYNGKVCWESDYEKGELCIGENTLRRFIKNL